MRDPQRIDNFCTKLAEYWKLVPDWRFGQLICNVLGTCKRDPFFYEEDEMLKIFEEFFAPYELQYECAKAKKASEGGPSLHSAIE